MDSFENIQNQFTVCEILIKIILIKIFLEFLDENFLQFNFTLFKLKFKEKKLRNLIKLKFSVLDKFFIDCFKFSAEFAS